MTQDLTAVAEAFSSHRFADVYPRLAPDVHWVIVGAGTVTGREAVVDACEQSLPELESSTREWLRFTTIAGARAVAVDTVARYVDAAHETSVVASCDIYEFDSDQLTRITSYVVEFTDGEETRRLDP